MKWEKMKCYEAIIVQIFLKLFLQIGLLLGSTVFPALGAVFILQRREVINMQKTPKGPLRV